MLLNYIESVIEYLNQMSILVASLRTAGTAFIVGCIGFVVLGSHSAMSESPPRECEEKVYVVKIHADWCGSCRATESVWERVRKELGNRATVVKLDVSDRVEYEKSIAEARRLGIEEFFQEYRGKTGVVAILDCRTREPVAVLNGERNFDEYVKAVTKAGRAS